MPPRVFISSTVTDLADVRSATKYWLEESGFEVLTSESSHLSVCPWRGGNSLASPS